MKSTNDSASRARDAASSKFSLMKTTAFNTETFNQLSQIPKNIRQKITEDGQVLVNAPEWCEEIWKTMRKNDFASQGAFNLAIIENIWNLHHRKFDKMLNVHNATQLFEVMDNDEDGRVGEDEQILIFSVIKEKMTKIAEDLSNIQEYVIYRDLMKAIRKLEVQIAKYQDFLRQKIYTSELDIYKKIGEMKFEEFYEYYEEEFKKFNTYSLDREAQMRALHEDQFSNLIDKLDRAVEAVKFKPKPQLKEYQTQERLVSIDERVEEAMNFRKELKDLEVSEAQRVNKMRMDNIEKQKNALLAEQRKEMAHLLSKLKNEENKLVIRMKRDFDILMKKTHLHENEIKKIQGLSAKYAMQKALQDGELKRMKAKSKKMNDIFTNTKMASVEGLSSKSPSRNTEGKKDTITLNSTDMFNKTNIELVKNISKSPNVIKFHLKKSHGEDKPVNVKPTNYANEDKLSHKKVEIYLTGKTEKKDEIPNLTSLYDDNLNLIQKSAEDKLDFMNTDEKRRTRQFINEKLHGDKRIVA